MKALYCYLFLLFLAATTTAQKSVSIDPELQKLKANLAAAGHDTTRLRIYAELMHYFSLHKSSDSILLYEQRIEPLIKKYPNSPYLPKLLTQIANGYRYKIKFNPHDIHNPKYDSIIKSCYRGAAKEAKRLHNEEYYLKSMFNLSSHYGDIDSVYQFITSSLRLIKYIESKPNKKAFDSLVLVNTYYNIILMFENDTKSQRFEKYLNKFGEYAKKNKNNYSLFLKFSFARRAKIYSKQQLPQLLKEYAFLKQRQPADSVDLKRSLVDYYFNIKEYTKAFELSSKLPEKYHNTSEVVNIQLIGLKYLAMGTSAYMLNKNEEAIHYLLKSRTYIESASISMQNVLYLLYEYLGYAYQKKGDYKKATAYLVQAKKQYEELQNTTLQSLMANNEVELEELKQERKVQAVQTRVLLQEQEAQLQKQQKYGFALLALLALISTGWAFYNFRKTRQQNAVISQQAAALEESNYLKDKIFALLSHDLRAPINRLIISLNHSIESQRSTIQAELKGVQDILNNVLYWASMQLKGSTPVYTIVPLHPLADSLIAEYEYILHEKNITFLNAIDARCELKTDENYLKIILRNLITNAIKFTAENGFIQIDCQIKDKVAQIILRDTGIGIAADKLQQVFHYPTPNVGTKKEKGTGLGLGLSLDIAKKLEGDITLTSQEGKGTQVTVSMPAS